MPQAAPVEQVIPPKALNFDVHSKQVAGPPRCHIALPVTGDDGAHVKSVTSAVEGARARVEGEAVPRVGINCRILLGN